MTKIMTKCYDSKEKNTKIKMIKMFDSYQNL